MKMMEIFVVEQVQIHKEEDCELLPLATKQLCKRDLSNANAQHNEMCKKNHCLLESESLVLCSENSKCKCLLP